MLATGAYLDTPVDMVCETTHFEVAAEFVKLKVRHDLHVLENVISIGLAVGRLLL